MGNKLGKNQLGKHYVIHEKLGTGSFATVKRAERKEDGKMFALKIIKKTKLRDTDLATVHDEVNIMKKLSHENVVTLFDTFETHKKIVMVIELLSGGELFDRVVEKGNFSEKEAASLMKSVASAIKYLHDTGIVHRDLKPENLLYATPADDSPVKITDFGLAKFRANSSEDNLTTPCGTPGYVAPEVINSRPYGPPVDMWSLGVILYILLCGFPPFFDNNTQELYKQIKHAAYDFPDPYWKDISASAKDLVRSLLELDVKKRLTAQQVLDHPWVSGGAAPDTVLGPDYAERLKLLQAKRVLRRTVKAVIAISKFSTVLSKYMAKIEATPQAM